MKSLEIQSFVNLKLATNNAGEGGGGALLKKVLYREALRRALTPYSFIYHYVPFRQKLYPFCIPFSEKGTPFIYLKDMAKT